jgi:hypothetical protein
MSQQTWHAVAMLDYVALPNYCAPPVMRQELHAKHMLTPAHANSSLYDFHTAVCTCLLQPATQSADHAAAATAV